MIVFDLLLYIFRTTFDRVPFIGRNEKGLSITTQNTANDHDEDDELPWVVKELIEVRGSTTDTQH